MTHEATDEKSVQGDYSAHTRKMAQSIVDRYERAHPGQEPSESACVAYAYLRTLAVSENARPSETEKRIVQLEKALRQCVNVAKAWHGEDAFDLYYNHSPEMKLIRDAIGKIPEEF